MSDWAPFAVRRDGPAEKHGYPGYPEPGIKRGVVCHSMEGPLSAALAELDKLTRRASWTFSNPKVGQLLQHYPLGAHTWASGSLQANVLYTSCEHEGGAGEPLTENQIANDVTLFRWLHDTQGWIGYDRRMELWEHQEAVSQYGGGATACPSGRIPWHEITMRLQEEPMTDADWAKLKALIESSEKDIKDYVHSELQDVLRLVGADVRLDAEAKATLARIEAAVSQ